MGAFTMRHVIIFIFTLSPLFANAGLENLNKPGHEYCFSQGEKCIDTAPRTIDGEVAAPACWEYEEEFTCYSYPQNTDCTAEENAMPEQKTFDIINTPLLTNIQGTALIEFLSWKEEKISEEYCNIETGFECTDWYPTPDDFLAKTCYTEEPTACEPEGCMVLKETCTNFSNGVCIMEKVEFTCDAGSVCTGTGIEAVSELGTGMGEYIAATSVADVVSEYSEFDELTNQVTLFTGESESCKRFTSKGEDAWATTGYLCAGIASVIGNAPLGLICAGLADLASSGDLRCCQDDPSDIAGTAVDLGYCDEGDIELAVARKTKRAVQVGLGVNNQCNCAAGGLILERPKDYIGSFADSFMACSHLCKNEILFPTSIINENIVMDKREEWCKFNDPLAKIIQVQGREQIEAIINSPASTKQNMTLTPNYSSANAGKWSAQSDIAGNIVSFWEWDSACFDPNQAYEAQSESSVYCPSSASQVVAVCSNPEEGCGDIPVIPNPIDTDWDLRLLLGTTNGDNQGINKYIRAKGECLDSNLDDITDSCTWDLMGLPAGIGSQSIIITDMNWAPHMPMGDNNATELQWINKFSTSTLEIETVSATHMSSAPASPVARVRQFGAPSWEVIPLNKGFETKFTTLTGSELTFDGDCTQYACRYTMATIHNLTLKPWYTYTPNTSKNYTLISIPLLSDPKRRVHYGERYTPHCDGFSLEEFMALDIGKMDLSDYLDTINEEAREKIRSLLID